MTPQELDAIAKENGLQPSDLNLTNKATGEVLGGDELNRLANDSSRQASQSKVTGHIISGTPLANLSESEQQIADGLAQTPKGSAQEANREYTAANVSSAHARMARAAAAIQDAASEGIAPSDAQVAEFKAAVAGYAAAKQEAALAVQQLEQGKRQRFDQAIEAHVGPVLDAQGLSAAEKAAALDVIKENTIKFYGDKLRDTDDAANMVAADLANALEESTFDYPGQSKVHTAVYRAFDAVAVQQNREPVSVKPAAGGQIFKEANVNQDIAAAMQKQNLPVPQVNAQQRESSLNAQLNAGVQRMAAVKDREAVAAERAMREEQRNDPLLRPFVDRIEQMEARKAQLENNPSRWDKVKAFLSHGPKGIKSEIAKVDLEIAAAKSALKAVNSGQSVQEQMDMLEQKQARRAGVKQELHDAKLDLKGAEQAIDLIERQLDVHRNLRVALPAEKHMRLSEKLAMAKIGNEAINDVGRLAPKVEDLKGQADDLKADIKIREKALSIRNKLGNQAQAHDAPQHSNAHGHSR